MLRYFDEFLSDPIAMITVFLLAFPGRILALSAHEFAHAWVANRCGDPTAKWMGRMTLNPLKHLDPLGALMMVLVGFGWAKPVPVNPNNFRHYRKDDLKVSLAGVTMNILMFLLGMVLLTVLVGVAIATSGEKLWLGMSFAEISRGYGFISGALTVVNYRFGKLAYYLCEMLVYFIITNLVLCLFNLLPVPPLDGYHVLNDLVLKRSLFADPNLARTASGVLMVLAFTGVLGKVLGVVDNAVLDAVGNVAVSALRAMGLAG